MSFIITKSSDTVYINGKGGNRWKQCKSHTLLWSLKQGSLHSCINQVILIQKPGAEFVFKHLLELVCLIHDKPPPSHSVGL